MPALISASDLIGIAIVAVVILGGLLLLNHITKPYPVKNEEEFQKRRQESPGLLNAAAMGLQQVFDPSAKKAMEVQQDLRRGIYDDKEEADDPPEAGAEADARARGRGASPAVGEPEDQNRRH